MIWLSTSTVARLRDQFGGAVFFRIVAVGNVVSVDHICVPMMAGDHCNHVDAIRVIAGEQPIHEGQRQRFMPMTAPCLRFGLAIGQHRLKTICHLAEIVQKRPPVEPVP